MSATPDLEGRTAVVTGASSGIGRAVAERLGSAGATVYLGGRTVEPMEATIARIEASGGHGVPVVFDVRDGARLQAMIRRAAEETGRLDVMVNNAGLGHAGPLLADDPSYWTELLEVNVLALLIGCKTAVEAMRSSGNGGHIINISSIAALRPDAGAYGATKVAVNYLTAALRQELEADDIRVTSLMPGVVATNFARNLDPEVVAGVAAISGTEFDFTPGERLPDEALEAAQSSLSNHIAAPEDIADAVDFVLSQPFRINIPEIIVRPAQSLDL